MESLAKNHKRGHVLFHQRASVIAFHKCKEQSSLFTDPLLSLQRSLRSYENYGEFHAPRSIELSKKKKTENRKKKKKKETSLNRLLIKVPMFTQVGYHIRLD